MTCRTITILGALLVGAAMSPALADGDAAKGKAVFRKCAACHSVEPEGGAKVGPNLHDVVGRATASLEDFKYSDPMKKLGEEGHIWTPEEIAKFVENPKNFLPGTKMTFAGLKKPQERDDVVAYLESLEAQ